MDVVTVEGGDSFFFLQPGLNPSDETFAKEVQPMLAEAYALAVGKHKQ